MCYFTSLSERCKACLPSNGPRENFAAFVEWVLENDGLFFPVCPTEDTLSPTPQPETSQPSLRCTERLHEPTVRHDTRSACTTAIIAPEPEPEDLYDQVPATMCVALGVLVEIEGLE